MTLSVGRNLLKLKFRSDTHSSVIESRYIVDYERRYDEDDECDPDIRKARDALEERQKSAVFQSTVFPN
jgi:hypothetical protein